MEENFLGLTGRQKMIFEAVVKIFNGHRQMLDGKIELDNLVPEGSSKTMANKTVRETTGFRKSNKTDKQFIDDILALIDKGERVTAFYLHQKFKIGERRVRHLRDQMKKERLILETTAERGARIWTRATARTQPETYIAPEDNADKVLEVIKTNPWANIPAIATALHSSWYPVKRTLDYLVDKGRAKKVQRAENPVHKGTSSFSRKFGYWEVA